MDDAMADLETRVHPHGEKWWRYRYQYSILEGFLLVPIFILVWIVVRTLRMMLVRCKALAKHTNQLSSLWMMYKYAGVSFVLYMAACVLVLAFFYTLYHTTSFFDWYAGWIRYVLSPE